jgi:hypothetical protein
MVGVRHANYTLAEDDSIADDDAADVGDDDNNEIVIAGAAGAYAHVDQQNGGGGDDHVVDDGDDSDYDDDEAYAALQQCAQELKVVDDDEEEDVVVDLVGSESGHEEGGLPHQHGGDTIPAGNNSESTNGDMEAGAAAANFETRMGPARKVHKEQLIHRNLLFLYTGILVPVPVFVRRRDRGGC